MPNFKDVVIGGLIAAVAAIAGSWFTYLNTDRGHDIDMVRISLSILSGENQDSSIYGRRFALRALAKYADVPIPEDEFETWAASGTVPDIGWQHFGLSGYHPSMAGEAFFDAWTDMLRQSGVSGIAIGGQTPSPDDISGSSSSDSTSTISNDE